MKTPTVIMVLFGLLLLLSAASVQVAGGNESFPPVEQPLVREGDFARMLIEALKLPAVESEAEAQSELTALGIAPRNGWIADYPLTPDTVGDLREAAAAAADRGRLPLTRDESLDAVDSLVASLELPILPDDSTAHTYDQLAYDDYRYADPAVIGGYYYDTGPPVVTYYPPPWDYYYLYSWVPYPFFYSGYAFTGYFILNDFHKYHRYPHRHGFKYNDTYDRRVITNHVRSRDGRRFHKIDPLTRNRGDHVAGRMDRDRARRIVAGDADRRRDVLSGRDRIDGRSGASRIGADSPEPRNRRSFETRGSDTRRPFTNETRLGTNRTDGGSRSASSNVLRPRIDSPSRRVTTPEARSGGASRTYGRETRPGASSRSFERSFHHAPSGRSRESFRSGSSFNRGSGRSYSGRTGSFGNPGGSFRSSGGPPGGARSPGGAGMSGRGSLGGGGFSRGGGSFGGARSGGSR